MPGRREPSKRGYKGNTYSIRNPGSDKTAGAEVKATRHISGKQASAYFAAMRHARDQDNLPTLSVTVNLSCTDCPPGEASIVMQELISHRFGRWLRYKSQKSKAAGGLGYPLVYGWVIEAKNEFHHAHWCVQVAPELRVEFERKLPKWVKSVAGEIRDAGRCICIKEITTIMALARYCMKGMNPNQARRRFVQAEDQGVVYGKRVGISRSLGKTARRTKTPTLLAHAA